jgi:hypothetical protein
MYDEWKFTLFCRMSLSMALFHRACEYAGTRTVSDALHELWHNTELDIYKISDIRPTFRHSC